MRRGGFEVSAARATKPQVAVTALQIRLRLGRFREGGDMTWRTDSGEVESAEVNREGKGPI